MPSSAKSQGLWPIFHFIPKRKTVIVPVNYLGVAGVKMDWASILEKLETSAIIGYLEALDLHTLVNHPYFLYGTAGLAILALFMRWRVVLVTILTVSGFAWLLAYTMQQGTSLEGGVGSETLMVFVGGGAVIVFVAIYFLFIRGE